MMYYDKIITAVDKMTEDERKGLAEILDLYKLCRGDERGLFMFTISSFLRDNFFTTFVEPEIKS